MHGCLGRETPLREGPSCCTVTVPLPSDDQAFLTGPGPSLAHGSCVPGEASSLEGSQAPPVHQLCPTDLNPSFGSNWVGLGITAGFTYRDGMDERVKGHKPGEQGLEPEDLVGLQHFSSLQEEPGSNPASLGLPKPRARIKFAVRV